MSSTTTPHPLRDVMCLWPLWAPLGGGAGLGAGTPLSSPPPPGIQKAVSHSPVDILNLRHLFAWVWVPLRAVARAGSLATFWHWHVRPVGFIRSICPLTSCTLSVGLVPTPTRYRMTGYPSRCALFRLGWFPPRLEMRIHRGGSFFVLCRLGWFPPRHKYSMSDYPSRCAHLRLGWFPPRLMLHIHRGGSFSLRSMLF